MCLVAFQKIFRKIFSGVWKRRRKTQPRKNSTQFKFFLSDLSPARSRDGEIAIDGSSSQISRSSSTDLPLRSRDLPQRIFLSDRSPARSCRCEIAINGEIAIDGSSSRISRSSSTDLPLGLLAGALSRRRDHDQRRDLAVARSRSMA